MRIRPSLRRVGLATLAVATTLGAFAGTAAARTSDASPSLGVSARTPCIGAAPVHGAIQHVIVLFMENQPYVDIAGSPDAPYVNNLAARCGQASNYHNITHPSAPEYIAVTSGLLGGAGDCPPVFLDPSWPPTCPDPNDNIFHQTMVAGETWKNYEESMATNCFEGEDSSNYDINHNPAAYYTDLGGPSRRPGSACSLFDVPMGSPRAGQFEHDLSAGTLPSYAFVEPDLIHDTHDSTIAVGDQYLSTLIPTIFQSPQYRDGSTVLFLTWDEGEHGHTDNCAYNTTDIGCHVFMVVASPYTVPGTVSGRLFNHYSLLKSDEQLLGLPLLGNAAHPRVKSMLRPFNLIP
jgi:hypothetical protein